MVCTIMRAREVFRYSASKIFLVRYDNETGKGDHRHYGDREEAYSFESLEKLLEDFREDCARLAGWRWE